MVIMVYKPLVEIETDGSASVQSGLPLLSFVLASGPGLLNELVIKTENNNVIMASVFFMIVFLIIEEMGRHRAVGLVI